MKKQWMICSVLLTISLFVRLIQLDTPNEVIFDEVHWGKYVTAYAATGNNLFDVHPPHGKLLVAALLKWTKYDGQQSFEKIGDPLTHVSGITLRILPALSGALVPFFLYLIFLHCGVSVEMAFLFSLCSALDNALILQSRVMGLYPMLLLALVSSFYFALKVKEDNSQEKTFSLILCGVTCGFALGFQFTGITALAVVFFILGWKAYKPFIGITVIALFVYLLGWKIHFALLPNPGFGDAFYKNTGEFWTDLIQLHQHMYRASATLTTSHPDASLPWSWPLMTKPIFYWAKPGRSLYFIGNPIVWWGISTLLLWHAFLKLKNGRKAKMDFTTISFCSFLVSYLPLTIMKRVLFLYHYLTPLTYAILFTGTSVNKMSKRNYYMAMGFIVLGFIVFSPLTYGWQMPEWYWSMMPWRLGH